MIEQLLIDATDRLPAWLVALLLGAAALSFAARHRALARYGRIREYHLSSLGVAVALAGLAVFYLFVAIGEPELAGRPVVVRLLLSLLALAVTAFNWGGVRAAIRDVRTAWERGRE